MARIDPAQVSQEQASKLLADARTVTGANIKGTARIVSMDELKGMLGAMLAEHGGASEQELAEREAQIRKEYEERIVQLENRIAELERLNGEADGVKREAVAAAEAAAAARIAELQSIIDNDDARARLAFLEQEVARLQALIDRYETELEVVTGFEMPEIGDDVSHLEELAKRASGPLSARIKYLQDRVPGARSMIEESVQAINERHEGHIYAVMDLLEQAVALSHYQQEIRSIRQALG